MEPEELTPKVECWWGFWYPFSTSLSSAKKEVSISKSISETLWCTFCYLEREECHHGNVQIRGLHIAFKPWAPHANHANGSPRTTRRQLFIITENGSKTSVLPSRGAGQRSRTQDQNPGPSCVLSNTVAPVVRLGREAISVNILSGRPPDLG